MRVARLEQADGTVVCARCLVAATPLQRLRGLLGRPSLPPDECLLLRPAGSIHMFFMRFPIDAVFCNRDLQVIDVVRGLRPWRFAARRHARVVIELAAGAASGVNPGDTLVLASIAE